MGFTDVPSLPDLNRVSLCSDHLWLNMSFAKGQYATMLSLGKCYEKCDSPEVGRQPGK